MASPDTPAKRLSLSDLLRYHLSAAARRAFSRGLGGLGQARLACSALRALVDEHVWQLRLSLANQDPDVTALLGKDGAWVQRWPKCRTLVVDVSNSELDQVLLLFASAPPATSITHLVLRCKEGSKDSLSGAGLMGVLRCVPNLEALTLGAVMAAPDSATERALASCAFAHLRCLRALNLRDYAWVTCLPAGLARQLTSLEVDPDSLGCEEFTEEVLAAIAKMAALEDLDLNSGFDARFDTRELGLLLGAAGPSMRSMRIYGWEPQEDVRIEVRCKLSGGHLTSFSVEDVAQESIQHANVSAYLAEVLLPCRALGPRLGLLELDLTLKVTADAPPDPDPAAELLARCDMVDLVYMEMEEGASAEALLEALRRKGPPPSPPALMPGLPPSPVSMPAIVGKAVQRMAAAPASSTFGVEVFLLLRGSAVRVLLAVPAALHAWAQQLAKEVAAGTPGPGQGWRLRVSGYQSLPTAGAVVVECGTGAAGLAAAEAAAEVARQLAGAGGDGGVPDGGISDGSAAAVLDAVPTGLGIDSALIQALWDGAEEGGPGPATGSREGEVARLRWLLETWEGLGGLPRKMELDAQGSQL
ncbi:hypothetical protein HYH03_010091 [Edaphochlamys debaryana]|uniref:Uncharacterized protein n=1 Tax=Edaphochlamys debaryana TaxID=47281 RepID=A0A836BXS5_9CHLO|nr:hypothetical protein HYH03_010091 [Edaphochlamys debaryana]|eukprot:KAG2491514.1 hypothetical protein HYH03_010091 [Edaphochlamys debaryana]